MTKRTVVVLAPNSFARFADSAVESQFQLVLRNGFLASLHNLDILFNSPIANPRLDNGFRDTNPMAGYFLESFLKTNGYDVRVVFDWSNDRHLESALSCDPVAIALSTTYITDNRLLGSCLSALRQVCGNLPIIVGGPYIWKQKIQFDRDSQRSRSELAEAARFGVNFLADCLFGTLPSSILGDAIYVVHEFGERTLLRVLNKLSEGKCEIESLADIPNLALPTSTGWHLTKAENEPVDLDEDYTRWDLVDEMPSMVPIRSSVGCPYRCRYCDFIELHPSVRMRSASSIAREIEAAKNRSARFFGFIDDNIFLSKKRIRELTSTFCEKSLNVTWGGFFRVDRIDEENIDDLLRSGCRFGLCGIESLDNGQLARMRKNCSTEEVRRGIELATAGGMSLNLSLLVGFPGETQSSIDNTIAAMNSLPVNNPGFASWLAYPLYVLPGTAVDDLQYRRRFGFVGRFASWRHDTMDSEAAGGYWPNYLHDRIDGLPYHYYAGDVPSFWTIERRQRAFVARRDLTRSLVRGEDEDAVQRAFSELFAVASDNPRHDQTPRWNTVLADRSEQPGQRERYTGAF